MTTDCIFVRLLTENVAFLCIHMNGILYEDDITTPLYVILAAYIYVN